MKALLTLLKTNDSRGGSEIPKLTRSQPQPIATIDDLHRRLTAREIGVPSPLMLLRGTEKLFVIVIPRELGGRDAGQRASLN